MLAGRKQLIFYLKIKIRNYSISLTEDPNICNITNVTTDSETGLSLLESALFSFLNRATTLADLQSIGTLYVGDDSI